jgi:NADH dehydrogenase
MKILILGGRGFVGRHVVEAALARGHRVVAGSRAPSALAERRRTGLASCGSIETRFERLTDPHDWQSLLPGIDAVVNAVGIQRERRAETYDAIHHLAPRALAEACAERAVRLVHVSALGLSRRARSRFIVSKLDGELAIAASAADFCIVRPSLLDGDGGFGARWLRRVARWPIHPVPADGAGLLAPLSVRDLGEAIVRLCEPRARDTCRVAELGGSSRRTMSEHLAALRREAGLGRALVLPVPGLLARLASHACDALQFSPFLFGHWELMQRDNVPAHNMLPALLGRAPSAVGQDPLPATGNYPRAASGLVVRR